MATFVFTGQDANNTANAATLVVNSEVPITFTINSGAENFVGNDPLTLLIDESVDDTISYVDYDGNVYSGITFDVTYEGQTNWRNGNSVADPQYTSHIAVITITSGAEAGQTYTLILGNPPDPNAPNPNQGTVDFTFSNGNHRSSPNEDGVFCFASGTTLATPDGDVAIEDLAIGDLVNTVDHGAQPIRWIGSTTVSTQSKNGPIVIEAHAFGANRPHSPLLVSPEHRMLVDSAVADLLFDCSETLVHAKDLLNDHSIRRATNDGLVRYFHVMFDSHELVYAQGAIAESFHPSQAADTPSTRRSLEELSTLFPERFSAGAAEPSARPTLSANEAKLIASSLN